MEIAVVQKIRNSFLLVWNAALQLLVLCFLCFDHAIVVTGIILQSHLISEMVL